MMLLKLKNIQLKYPTPQKTMKQNIIINIIIEITL